MRKLFCTLPLLLAASGLRGMPSEPSHQRHEPDTRTTLPESPDVCATGCSAVPLESGGLSEVEFERLIKAFGEEALAPGSPALETLLFHGESVRGLLASDAAPLLGAEHRGYLLGELDRDHAYMSVRIIDDAGRERLRLDEALIPLGEKQHLHPESTRALPPPEISGTLQRVGVEHLWARL